MEYELDDSTKEEKKRYMSESTPLEAFDRIMLNIKSIIDTKFNNDKSLLKNFEIDSDTVYKQLNKKEK